ncbi:MAG: ribonuclease R [Alphaproteobacteria bacterium]|nr:ribonuclease R [Alphaproteobacteria bacterium]
MAKRPPRTDGPKPERTRAELTRERVLAAIEANGGVFDKNGLARALGVAPDERRKLRAILAELEESGALGRVGRRGYQSAAALPDGGVMEIVDRDPDGELLGRFRGRDGLFGPLVRLAPGEARGGRRGEPALGIGDRAVVRIAREGGEPIARVVKRLGQSAHKILGVFHAHPQGGGRVEPADRKARGDIMIFREHQGDATDGDLVLVELQGGARPAGPKRGVVREVVGAIDDPRAASILAIHAHGIPMGFSEEEEAQATAAKPPTLKGRTDLRQLPLITIDPEDARDHDDAVFAQPDDDPKNTGGVRVWVAIADVAAYVTPGSALDRGAFKRGNSTYFPDRVAPMLPESLSADLCSLREGEERACLAVEMVFDADGRKKSHRFVRGLMKSAAKLSYRQAQNAFDGEPDEKTRPLVPTILAPLWAAYQVLKRGRDARQPLALEGHEHRVVFGPDGDVAGVARRATLEANKLIEEMMIQANVCAAETLEAKRTPLVYRIHDQPSKEKIAQLTDFLQTVRLNWAKGEVVTPGRFNRLLAMARETEHADIVNEVVLRTQAQAIYFADNIGHFGLNLAKYAHFTSPIRRYADLIVHRALIRALGLGDDGLTEGEIARLEEIAEHISMTERRSMAAERDATERYVAAFLADRVGATFEGRISGVTRFGLFVKLKETAADGLAPISTLGAEYWAHDEASHALVGESSGRRYQLGQDVEVRLEDVAPVSGGLVFHMLSDPLPPAPGWTRSARGRSRGGRPGPAHAPRPQGRPKNVRLGKSPRRGKK